VQSEVSRGGVEPPTFRFSVGFGLVSVLHCASVRKAISSQSSIHVPLWIMVLRYVCEKIAIRLALFHKSYQGAATPQVDSLPRPFRTALRLYWQEVNLTTSAIARMNLFLHDIEEVKVTLEIVTLVGSCAARSARYQLRATPLWNDRRARTL